MPNYKQRRTSSVAFAILFAVAWIGALSMYWIRIKMSPQFQHVLGIGIGLRWPASLIYVSVVYVSAITFLLWVGLGLYLALSGRFRLRWLLRGLLTILPVVAIRSLIGLFFGGFQSPAVNYIGTWLPIGGTLLIGMWVTRHEDLPRNLARGRKQPVAPVTRPSLAVPSTSDDSRR